jgi:hypothetical protein
MDPLTCLSVAGTVAQFVDFSFKILKGTLQLYEDGQLAVHEQTARVVKDLSNFSTQMHCSVRAEGISRALTENELELEKLCKECGVLADDMISRLNKFKASDKRQIWNSVGQVFMSVWSKKELDALESRLSKYRDMMNSRLLGCLRYVEGQ